jgi:hypothetical protein
LPKPRFQCRTVSSEELRVIIAVKGLDNAEAFGVDASIGGELIDSELKGTKRLVVTVLVEIPMASTEPEYNR